ncbi:MAG: hypothetical protein AVO39_00930 [delta proteobacterium MLS_D]|nr:MAG: hypothetical protein AVO39_00930 [delta proteobacterium MLS_D]
MQNFQGLQQRRSDHPFFRDLPAGGRWVAAHRGAALLWPENTLPAFERSLDRGVHILEMDARLTADGIPVIMHDETVDRTTDGTGRVREYSFAELRRLNAGWRWEKPDQPGVTPWRGKGCVIPSLEEVFQAFPGARIVLEIKEKDSALVLSVGELVQKYARHNLTMVASFYSPVLKIFRSRFSGVATSAGRSEVFLFWLAEKLRLEKIISPCYEALQVPERFRGIQVVTAGFVRAALRRGLSVHVWTVNDPRDMARFFDMGVDAVITDAPDRAPMPGQK